MSDQREPAQLLLAMSRMALGYLDENRSPNRKVPGHDFVRLASVQAIIPTIAQTAERYYRGALPEDLLAFLILLKRENDNRNLSLLDRLLQIKDALARHGIRAVALKGAAELLSPTYPLGSSRYLSDLDILIAPGDLDATRAILLDTHTPIPDAPISDGGAQLHHDTPLVHRTDGIFVELHTRLVREDSNALSASEILSTATQHAASKLWIPEDKHRFAHCLAHAVVDDRAVQRGEFRLRDLFDIGCLLQRNDALDVALLVSSAISPRWRRHALTYLGAIALAAPSLVALQQFVTCTKSQKLLDLLGDPSARRLLFWWDWGENYSFRLLT